MAKTKPDVKAQAKKSVATNAMFKKTGKEALRQENSRHMKDAVEKPTKTSKSSKGRKPKDTAKPLPAHPLDAQFAGKIRLIQQIYFHSKFKMRQPSLRSRVRLLKTKLSLFSTTPIT